MTKTSVLVFAMLTFTSCSYAADTWDFRDYSTLATIDGKPQWIKCPQWDWALLPAECRFPGFNCVPVCGKWPGDKVDIGAYQYVPGITSEKPWGDWNGIPFSYTPGEIESPKGFRIQQ